MARSAAARSELVELCLVVGLLYVKIHLLESEQTPKAWTLSPKAKLFLFSGNADSRSFARAVYGRPALFKSPELWQRR